MHETNVKLENIIKFYVVDIETILFQYNIIVLLFNNIVSNISILNNKNENVI